MDDDEFRTFLSEARDKQLPKLHRYLARVLDLVAGYPIRNDPWNLSAGSVLAQEYEAARADGFIEPFQSAVWLARLALYASIDHLRTLRRLLDLDCGVLGPPVVARAALEAGARAAWL